jgi:hypothetical protein
VIITINIADELSRLTVQKEAFQMKKFLALTTATMLMLSAMGVTAFAGDGITLVVNGETVDFTGDQEPVIQNGRTLVPLRAAFEKMGATVTWFDDVRLCEATYEGVTVGIKIGETTVSINDGAEIESDVPAQIINGRTMVPLRVLSESIGAKVDWDNATKTVTVTTPEIKGETPTKVSYETKTAMVEGKVSKISYSYPVVTDVYTFADLLNKNIAANVAEVAQSIADENGTGKAELNITFEVKDNDGGIFSVMYLIDGEDVAIFHYAVSDGAAMTDEGYEDAMYGGTAKSDDDRYTIEDYSNALQDNNSNTYIYAISYYPQFTGDADFIPGLNTQLENSAKKVVDSFIASYQEDAAKLHETEESLQYDYFEDFEVEISDDNVATITTHFTEKVYGRDDRTGDDTIKVDLNTGEIL